MTAFPPEQRPGDEDPSTDDDPRRTATDTAPTGLRDSTRRAGQASIAFLLAVLVVVVLIILL